MVVEGVQILQSKKRNTVSQLIANNPDVVQPAQVVMIIAIVLLLFVH